MCARGKIGNSQNHGRGDYGVNVITRIERYHTTEMQKHQRVFKSN